MTTAAESLSIALACDNEVSERDSTIAEVATLWFANWLRTQAQLELADGKDEAANGLIKVAYRLESE